MVDVVFIKDNGVRFTASAKPGETVLDAAHGSPHSEAIGIEGACEGSMACSTCHVRLRQEDSHLFPDPSEEEEDLLDLAYGAMPTSRLGCQLVLEERHNGLEIFLPKSSRNLLL